MGRVSRLTRATTSGAVVADILLAKHWRELPTAFRFLR
jgi:hypothetical protein